MNDDFAKRMEEANQKDADTRTKCHEQHSVVLQLEAALIEARYKYDSLSMASHYNVNASKLKSEIINKRFKELRENKE